MIGKTYYKSVFINCPYDPKYEPLLNTMLFTLLSLGFYPRLSLDNSDAGISRIDKIIDLISKCKICIHDLSRVKAMKKKEFARMNMPFELGLDFGCLKYSGDEKHHKKMFLILGDKEYEYIKAISDIKGIDIEYHNNNQYYMINSVRHWFVNNNLYKGTASPREIWYKYTDYWAEYVIYTRNKGYSNSEMYKIPIKEQIDMMEKFINDNPYD
jgi:hypothetical protein